MPINADGLNVNYGPDEAGPARVTEYKTDGPRRFVEIIVDADFLPASGTMFFDEYMFYSNGNIESIEVGPESETFADGTSINVSLVDKDGSSNAVSLTTFTLAHLNAQEQVTLDVQLTAMKRVLLTTVGTFTAGKATIRIFYSVPKEEADTLVWNKSA